MILLITWLCFHEYDMCFIDFECWWSCDLHVFHEIYSCFISCLKNFVLIFQIYHKTSYVILHLEEFSIMLNYFQTYFWKPLPLKGGWMGDHALWAELKIFLNKCMIGWKVFMSYTLDPHCVFNWYHNWYLFYILIFVSIYVCFNFK